MRNYRVTLGSQSEGFPTANNTGVPAGWVPTQTLTSDVIITQQGAVIEDLRLDHASFLVRANDVTIRRCEIIGGGIINAETAPCKNGLLLEDVTISKGTNDGYGPRVYAGGYTARRMKVVGVPEGFRVGEKQDPYFAGPVLIDNCYIHIVRPDLCDDWHGDGIQGFNGAQLTIKNTAILYQDTTPELGFCDGTASLFWPNQGNDEIFIDGLLVSGGGFVVRIDTPGSVSGLRIVNNSWNFGAHEVTCGILSEWEAKIVDTFSANPTIVADLPC